MSILWETEKTQSRDGHMKREAKIGMMHQKPRSTWSHRKLEEAKEDSSPRGFRGILTLLTPWFQTSSPWNGKRHVIAVLNHTGCDSFLQQSQEANVQGTGAHTNQLATGKVVRGVFQKDSKVLWRYYIMIPRTGSSGWSHEERGPGPGQLEMAWLLHSWTPDLLSLVILLSFSAGSLSLVLYAVKP